MKKKNLLTLIGLLIASLIVSNPYIAIAKKDVKKPIIKLSNKKTVYKLDYGEYFSPPKATAVDNVDGKWTIKPIYKNNNGKTIKKIDATKPGKYKVIFIAVDKSKNKAKKTIEVQIKAIKSYDIKNIK